MDQKSNLDRIQIVLVGTQDGANVGSVCRAMKTMGITRLVLVGVLGKRRVQNRVFHAEERIYNLQISLSELV